MCTTECVMDLQELSHLPYDEFIKLMGNDTNDFKDLSLMFGKSNMKSFIQMKKDVYSWYESLPANIQYKICNSFKH